MIEETDWFNSFGCDRLKIVNSNGYLEFKTGLPEVEPQMSVFINLKEAYKIKYFIDWYIESERLKNLIREVRK